MSVGESHAFCGESVDVGRGDPAAIGVVTPYVAVAEVVGADHDDVGRAARAFPGVGSGGQQGQQTGDLSAAVLRKVHGAGLRCQ